MSELKVNEITGLGGTVKINDPVGLGAVARSGYQLNSNGKVNVEGSVEVVTVPASNFGVRIRAPINSTTSPGFGDSTLQFTNNQGTTEWASFHAKSNASLEIKTDGDNAIVIDNAQTINHLGASLFTNRATFNNSMDVNGQATFGNTVIPKCGGVPTVADHLTNKNYVDQYAYKPTPSNIYVAVRFYAGNRSSAKVGGNYSTPMPNGTYTLLWFADAYQTTSGYEAERDTYMGSGYGGVQTVTINAGTVTTFGAVADGAVIGVDILYGGYTAIFFKIA